MKLLRLAVIVTGTMLAFNLLAAETNSLPQISGTVRATNGTPAVGLDVFVYPPHVEAGTNLTIAKTDASGRFRFESYLSRDPLRFLMVRDPARNLAVARNLDEGTTVYDLELAPALVVSGRVQDQYGNPVTNAEVNLFIWDGEHGMGLYKADNQLKVNPYGRYEVSALPMGRRYSVYTSAKGYGSFSSDIQEPITPRFEFQTIVLKTADKKLAGLVLDAQSKPVAGIKVLIMGDQPNVSGVSDEKGEFAINGLCEGMVRVRAAAQNGQSLSPLTPVSVGDTNVVIVLGPRGTAAQTNRRPLAGKPLPDLTATGIPANLLQTNKPLLICLFDPEQRSSRRVVNALGERNDSLKQKGLTVIGISAALTTSDALKTWKQSNPVPFPIGGVTEKTEKTKWILSTEKLPWLILSDTHGRVKAEGFDLEELDAKLK